MAFQNITFVYEGRIATYPVKPESEPIESKFQGFYAYRSNVATLLDLYTLNANDSPDARFLYSLLNYKFDLLDATPDVLPRVELREPRTTAGGAGSLYFPRSAQRIHLAWFLSSLGGHDEHEYQYLGDEVLSGSRCHVVRMLRRPKPQLGAWEGPLPYAKLWIDLGKGGVVARMEWFDGDKLSLRTSFDGFYEVPVPGRPSVTIPISGLVEVFSESFMDRGKTVYRDSPTSEEHYRILRDTIKVNRDLRNEFFSIKRHALASSEEDLRALLDQLKNHPAPKPARRSPVSQAERAKRLDDALAEADRQSSRLDASVAASSEQFWTTLPAWILGAVAAISLAIAVAYQWRKKI
ncbi:hypothetical protein [Paludisphaera rhizosphaerae]|uniref:hypothetical protein n=1 Tax=Paludisphaera rhizosphaerae TaxID=2711216 RepID=UPI0013EE2A08|nr:hypothetical protein [Paludisphaera rhizosphaerae]